MLCTMLKGKIHRATVTEARVDYEGSLALDARLMEAAGFLPFEMVHVYDITNGARFATYLVEAPKGSGTVAVLGAAAHKVSKGDLVILCAYAQMPAEQARLHRPRLVYVNARNEIVRTSFGKLAA